MPNGKNFVIAEGPVTNSVNFSEKFLLLQNERFTGGDSGSTFWGEFVFHPLHAKLCSPEKISGGKI
jgi:hypothetical protein